MDGFNNVLKKVVSNIETNKKLENVTNLQDVYKVFEENGYTSGYEKFEKNVIDFFIKTKVSDYELEKIAGGKTKKTNQILAGMFSALTIANPALNISAAALDKKTTDIPALQANKSAKKVSLLDKFSAIFKSDIGKGVAIGGAVSAPVIAVGFTKLYEYLTSLNHRFSQIVDYCLENKDRTTDPANERYRCMLKEIASGYKKSIQKQNEKADSNDISLYATANGKNLDNMLSRMDDYVTELSDNNTVITIQRLGEIASDDFFTSIQLNVPKLPEFLAVFGKKDVNPLKAQLDKANKSLTRARQNLATQTSLANQKDAALQAEQQKVAQRDADLQAEKQKVAQRDADLQTEKQKVAQRDTALQTEKQKVAQRDADLQAEKQKVAQRDADLQAEKQKVAQRDADLQAEKQKVAQKDADLQAERQLVTQKDNRIKQLQIRRDDLFKTTQEQAKKISELELNTMLAQLEKMTNRYYSSTVDEKKDLEPVLNQLKESVINKFAGLTPAAATDFDSYRNSYVVKFLIRDNYPKSVIEDAALLRLMCWLNILKSTVDYNKVPVGGFTFSTTAIGFSNAINKKLSNLCAKDVHDCIDFVVNSSKEGSYHQPLIFCMNPNPLTKDYNAYLANKDSRERKIARSILIQDLIKQSIHENQYEWNRQIAIDKDDHSSLAMLRYYTGVLSRMRNRIYQESKYDLLRPIPNTSETTYSTPVSAEQYVYVRDYVLNACDIICKILERSNNGEPWGEFKHGGTRKKKSVNIENDVKKPIFDAIKAFTDVENAHPVNSNASYANAKPLLELLNSVCDAIEKLPFESTNFQSLINQLKKIPKQIFSDSKEYNRRDILELACHYSNEAYVTDNPLPGHPNPTRQLYANEWFGNINPEAAPGKEQWAGLVKFVPNQNSVVVAYHGTDCGADMWTDADYSFDTCEFIGGQNVHHGFLTRYELTKDAMRQKLEETIASLPADFDKAQLKIVVTGHSLGGALSTLAALDLVKDRAFLDKCGLDSNQINLVTFCSPRVLSKEAYAHIRGTDGDPNQKLLIANAIRFWRFHDTVSAVPTGRQGYKHVGQSWCLDKIPDNTWSLKRWLDPFSHHYMDDIENDVRGFIADPTKVKVELISDELSTPSSSPELDK